MAGTGVLMLHNRERQFIEPYLPPGERVVLSPGMATLPPPVQEKDALLPFVTLTYAQSLDGMIALAPGTRTTLSGQDSKDMTHYLRLYHDAILVGATTAVTDNPSLNCRIPGTTLEQQPQPVIVDPNARFTLPNSKVGNAFEAGLGKEPWFITRPKDNTSTMKEHCRIFKPGEIFERNDPDKTTATDKAIPWRSILEALKHEGINSVMIEGGASVIASLLLLPELVDSVIITIAPTYLGQGGVSIAPPKAPNSQDKNPAWLQDISTRQFGQDVVLCGRPVKEYSTFQH